jgi:hypothetical protein
LSNTANHDHANAVPVGPAACLRVRSRGRVCVACGRHVGEGNPLHVPLRATGGPWCPSCCANCREKHLGAAAPSEGPGSACVLTRRAGGRCDDCGSAPDVLHIPLRERGVFCETCCPAEAK